MSRFFSLLFVLAVPVLMPARSFAQPATTAPATAATASQPPVGIIEVPSLGMSVRDFTVVAEPPVAGSPAAKAGFRPNDVVMALGGRAVVGAETFIAGLRAMPTRAEAQVTVRRGRELLNFKVKLDDWDTPGPQTRGRLGLSVTNFVIVQKVAPNGVARQMGMGGGEVLLVVNARQAKDAATVTQAAKAVPALGASIAYRRGRESQSARVSPQGKVAFVSDDSILAEQTGLRAASDLAEIARNDAASAERLKGQRVDGVGVVENVVSAKTLVSVFLTNATSPTGDTPDTISVDFKTGPLADAVRGLKRGDTLFFRGTPTTVKRKEQESDSANDFLDAVLTGPQKSAPKVIAVTLYISGEELLKPPPVK